MLKISSYRFVASCRFHLFGHGTCLEIHVFAIKSSFIAGSVVYRFPDVESMIARNLGRLFSMAVPLMQQKNPCECFERRIHVESTLPFVSSLTG